MVSMVLMFYQLKKSKAEIYEMVTLGPGKETFWQKQWFPPVSEKRCGHYQSLC